MGRGEEIKSYPGRRGFFGKECRRNSTYSKVRLKGKFIRKEVTFHRQSTVSSQKQRVRELQKDSEGQRTMRETDRVKPLRVKAVRGTPECLLCA